MSRNIFNNFRVTSKYVLKRNLGQNMLTIALLFIEKL